MNHPGKSKTSVIQVFDPHYEIENIMYYRNVETHPEPCLPQDVVYVQHHVNLDSEPDILNRLE